MEWRAYYALPLREGGQEQAASAAQFAPGGVNRVRALRKTMTDAEHKLWSALRNKQLGVKFRRQQPMGNYIADFFCAECNLIVELDGSQHMEQTSYDAKRTAYLKKTGNKVLRFWNNDIFNNLEGVLIRIQETIHSTPTLNSTPTLTLPRQGGGNKELLAAAGGEG